MLLSMTGYGESQRREAGLAVEVQVRTVNNRHFKLNVRTSEGFASLEGQIEDLVRREIKRGAVTVNVYVDRQLSPDDYRINAVVLEGYRRQLQELYDRQAAGGQARPAAVSLEALLSLPGVVDEHAAHGVDAEVAWPVLEAALLEALANLARMRAEEGRAMAGDLAANSKAAAEILALIETRAPLVVTAFRQRLSERLGALLADFKVRVEPADVVREVGLFAERADVAEEIVRLKSHLDQFTATLDEPDSAGRKLDFVVQEMFREANTIGAKANDAVIARLVVDLKTAVERMREMIQNAE